MEQEQKKRRDSRDALNNKTAGQDVSPGRVLVDLLCGGGRVRCGGDGSGPTNNEDLVVSSSGGRFSLPAWFETHSSDGHSHKQPRKRHTYRRWMSRSIGASYTSEDELALTRSGGCIIPM